MLSELNDNQRALAEFMSSISEAAFSAEWMENLEHVLWRAVLNGPLKYGHHEVNKEQIQKLNELSAACGGWIYFDESDEETFVGIGAWRKTFYDAEKAL